MPFNNISGSYGSNKNRGNSSAKKTSKGWGAGSGRIADMLQSLSPERWVDLICISSIVIFLIVVLCTWKSFSEALFINVLLPLIGVLSGIMTAVAVIGGIILYVSMKFRRGRYWW